MKQNVLIIFATLLSLTSWTLDIAVPREINVADGDILTLEEYILGSSVLKKTGDGKLVWPNPFTFNGETRIEAGTIETGYESLNLESPEIFNLLAASALWLDATDEDSFSFDEDENITAWQDKLGRNTAASDARSEAPTRTGTLNNLPTVDFGTVKTGASMQLTTRLDRIRTVFWVIDLAGNKESFLLGDTSTYHFHRNTGSGAYWNAGNTSPHVRDGRTYNNGVLVTTPTTTIVPSGYQLISLVTLDNVQANALARDRNISNRWGGQQIAEILIYERALDDSERQLIEAYLRQKWFTDTAQNTSYNLIRNLTVAGPNTVVTSLDHSLHVGALSHIDQAGVSFPQSVTFDRQLTLSGTFDLNTTQEPLLFPLVMGKGNLNLSSPPSIDTLVLAGEIAFNQDLHVQLLTGSGSLNAPTLQATTLSPATNSSIITLEPEAENCHIEYLYAPQGGTVVMADQLTINQAIAVDNSQTLVLQTPTLIAPLLTGNGTNDLTAVSNIAVDKIAVADNEHLTIKYGTQNFVTPLLGGNGTISFNGTGNLSIAEITVAEDEHLIIDYGIRDLIAPLLSGSGQVTFVGSGTLTINDPQLFEGTIGLSPWMELIITGTHISLNKLEIHGSNAITIPANINTLDIALLIGDGQLRVKNSSNSAEFSIERIILTDDLHLIDNSLQHLLIPKLGGNGRLTSNRPLDYAGIILDGPFNLPAGVTTLHSLSGDGTLNISINQGLNVGTLTLNGTIAIQHTGGGTLPLTVDTLEGHGTLNTATLGAVTVSTLLAADQQLVTLETGAHSATILRSYGLGTMAKAGSGSLYFSQNSTLQAIRIKDNCALMALPSETAINPVQDGLTFWLDASVTNSLTLVQDPAGNEVISEWRDARDSSTTWDPGGEFNAAYQETANAAPVFNRYTLNGLNIADLGPIGNHDDGQARWMQFQRDATIHSVILMLGSQEGGNALLTATDSHDYQRAQEADASEPLTPIFDGELTATPVQNGQTFLDSLEIANPATTGFNGNYQIVAVINGDNQTTTANRLARDRDEPDRTGGQRLAEMLIYNKALDDSQRMAVEGYLNAKWRPRIARLELIAPNVELNTTQAPLTIDVIVGPGGATKRGAFDLTVQDAGGLVGLLRIDEGKLITPETLYQPTRDGLANWYDASATAHFGFEEDGRIQTWQSRVGETHARRYSGDPAFSPHYDPYGLNGQPVVDMGVWNGQRHLRFDTPFEATCTAFMVYDSRYGGGWLFGGDDDHHFHRGDAGGDLTKPMLYPANYSNNARYSNLWQDGIHTATDLTQAFFKGDWETIILSTAGSVRISSLGQDRINSTAFNARTGGKRLAEVLLYTHAASIMERRYAERYLNRKWFGRFRNLAFADHTTFELAGSTEEVRVTNLSGTGRVVQSGTGVLNVHNAAQFKGTWVAALERLNLVRKLAPETPQPIPETWWLDASRRDTIELGDGDYEQGGIINTWHDLSASGATATRIGQVHWKPDMLNGLPVVDLGHENATNYMAYANRQTATGFVIFDSSLGGGFLFGHSTKVNFHRAVDGYGNPIAPIIHGEANDDWSLRGLRWGQWKINGERHDPRNRNNSANNAFGNIPPTYALYSFATRNGELAETDQLSRDRITYINQSAGGRQRLGEIIFHDRLIQPIERAATEVYLMNKWFGKTLYGFVSDKAPLFHCLELPAVAEPNVVLDTGAADEAIAIGTLIGATNITASGSGRLIIGSHNAHHSIAADQIATIVGRALPVENPVVDGSLELWVDASSPVEAFEMAGNGRITRWSDVRDIGTSGRAMFAFNDGTKLWSSTIQGPVLQANALNGRPVADFGVFSSKTWMGFVTGRNSHRSIDNIRTVFWVYNSEEGGGWLFGHNESNYDFHREGGEPITKEFTIFGGAANINNRHGSFYIDGEQVNPNYTSMSGGWELFTLKTQGNVSAATFSKDRSNNGDSAGDVSRRSGGQKLAEMLIYSRPLLDEERRDVEAYLAYKWFNRVEKGYRKVIDSTEGPTAQLEEGAILKLDSTTFPIKISGSGTVWGTPAYVAELAPHEAGLTFANGLTLIDGAIIQRNFDANRCTAGKIAVAGGLNVLGSGSLDALASSGVTGLQFPLFEYDIMTGTFGTWQLIGATRAKYKPNFADNDPENTASVKFIGKGAIFIIR